MSPDGEGPLYMSRPPRYPEIIRMTLPCPLDLLSTASCLHSCDLHPEGVCILVSWCRMLHLPSYLDIWTRRIGLLPLRPDGLYLVFCIHFSVCVDANSFRSSPNYEILKPLICKDGFINLNYFASTVCSWVSTSVNASFIPGI